MKIIALGDTHGESYWEIAVEDNKDADKIVFVGDYWDSFDVPFKEQKENFLKIIALKKQFPEKVVLLIGNHDFHYTDTANWYGDKYSGYQKAHFFEINQLMKEHEQLFQMCYMYKSFVFTHAGVTTLWLKRTSGIMDPDTKLTIDTSLDEYINAVYHHNPKYFLFFGHDHSGYGEHIGQSPIWVRPDSLMEDAYSDYRYVCGHTGVKRINPDGVEGRFFFIDTIDKSGQYLIIDGDAVSVGNIVEEVKQ